MLLLVLAMLPNAMAQTAALETAAHAALPYPDATTPKAIDRGEFKAQQGTTPMSVTVALRLPKLNEAENLLISLHTPGDPQFHQFLTSDQFVARFAPTNADVAQVIAGLAKYGLTAERTTATTLKATGLPADIERAFSVSLHSYEVPAHGNVAGYTFHAPLTHPTIPAEISASVAAVAGLDSRPTYRPLHRSAAPLLHQASPSTTILPATSGDLPGHLTVTDFANHYDVNPLYNQGISGSGRTIGIMTLANFTPSDAFAYWSALGLTVRSSRISIVNVDGGPGAPSDDSGSLETTLDVEQSGGIAPGANIIVYMAPNTGQGFIDLFAAAIEANCADSLSVSWGDWEWFYNLQNDPVTDPITGNTVAFTQAAHELFLRAAIQGQTLFAAAGDGGAYDANNDLGCFGPFSFTQPYSCSLVKSVDYPASDSAITAAGGTTLPVTLDFCLNAACTPPYYPVKVSHERVWGWDYLDGLCKYFGLTPITCGTFPGGGGGGVSITFDQPSYQNFLPGTQLSRPGQFFGLGSGFTGGAPLIYELPGNFPGRNLPDVSFNADPYTGYVVYYTSSVSGFGVEPGWGGTSFVAPQLNGVTALLGEDLHGHRIGLLNFPLYFLAITGQAYSGSNPPLNVIEYGDNWFYQARDGYSPAAGLGTLNVANFADAFQHLLF